MTGSMVDLCRDYLKKDQFFWSGKNERQLRYSMTFFATLSTNIIFWVSPSTADRRLELTPSLLDLVEMESGHDGLVQ